MAEAGGSNAYSDAELLTHIQTAYEEVVGSLDLVGYYKNPKSTTVTLVDGTYLYTVPAARKLILLIDPANRYKIPIKTVNDQDTTLYDAVWNNGTSITFYMLPYTGTFTLHYVDQIGDISADSIVEVPAQFHSVIAFTAVAMIAQIEKGMDRNEWEAKSIARRSRMVSVLCPEDREVRITDDTI